MEFTQAEMRDLVLMSYRLLETIPYPKPNKEGKYEIQSRNKLKSLPEALREQQDPAAAIAHFTKWAAYSLPRAERREVEARMVGYLDMLLKCIAEIEKDEKVQNSGDYSRVVEKVSYLLGYTNWSADAVCGMFTHFGNDEPELRNRLTRMLNAELGMVGAGGESERILKAIMSLKRQDNTHNRGRY